MGICKDFFDLVETICEDLDTFLEDIYFKEHDDEEARQPKPRGIYRNDNPSIAIRQHMN